MTDAWQIIGFFGSCVADIPQVVPGAVQDPSGAFVVVVDIAESDADLRAQESLSLEKFRECLAFAEATMLPPYLWEPGAVLFVAEGALEYVSVWEAEVRMKAFVRDRRAEGYEALRRGDEQAALQSFDRARRVSNEREDIEQVVALVPDPRVGEFFSQALERQAVSYCATRSCETRLMRGA
jgi:hypothetical protein